MSTLQKDRLVIAVMVIFLALSCPVVLAGTPDSTTKPAKKSVSDIPALKIDPAQTAEPVDMEKFIFKPYLANVTADEVYIRSGPAQIYYPVGKLTKDQQIIVCGEKHGKANWARIKPTQQCFSYISKQFVQLCNLEKSSILEKIPDKIASEVTTEKSKLQTPTKQKPSLNIESILGTQPLCGEVTGNYVRVRAGSIKVPPNNANQIQTKLNKGDRVQIIGQRDEYYKIVTPDQCFFWVSLEYLQSVGAVSEEKMAELQSQISTKAFDNSTEKTSDSGQMERNEYQEIARLFDVELQKPLKQRNIKPIRQRLEKLTASAQSPSIKAAASALSRQLARSEIALDVLDRSLAQDKQLYLTLEKIEREMELLMAVNNPAEKTDKEIVVKGYLALSAVFTTPTANRRFRVLNDKNEIIYYAVAEKKSLDLTKWLGKRVSLVGTARFDTFSKSRILHVTGILELPPGM